MYKKILLIVIIIACCILVGFSFKDNSKEYYSLDTLKDLLNQTETMIICLYDSDNPYKICSKEDTITSIADKDKIEEIINLIIASDIGKGMSTMIGAGTVIHTFDENGNFLVSVFYDPYIGLEKGTSFYVLESKNQERILEILK